MACLRHICYSQVKRFQYIFAVPFPFFSLSARDLHIEYVGTDIIAVCVRFANFPRRKTFYYPVKNRISTQNPLESLIISQESGHSLGQTQLFTIRTALGTRSREQKIVRARNVYTVCGRTWQRVIESVIVQFRGPRGIIENICISDGKTRKCRAKVPMPRKTCFHRPSPSAC